VGLVGEVLEVKNWVDCNNLSNSTTRLLITRRKVLLGY